MSESSLQDPPIFFILDHDGNSTRRIELTSDQLVIGRASTNDVVVPNVDVSRRHAAVRKEGPRVLVEDLGSTAGTRVNGVRITTPTSLETGDMIEMASVRLKYERRRVRPTAEEFLPSAASSETAAGNPGNDAFGVQSGTKVPEAVRYNIDAQKAGSINNVGANQYNTTHILRERQSLMRDVASTKTRARWIILCGFLLFVIGASFFAAGIIQFFTLLIEAMETGMEPPAFHPFGNNILGIPSGLLGWAAAAVGAVLMVIGTILHIIASARRKQIDRDHPIPRGSPPST